MLGDGQRDAGDVHFLKGVGAQHLRRDLAGDADDGHRVEHRGRDARDEIGCARPTGGHADADAARSARIAIGHVRSALLMTDENVADGELAQRVVDRQDGAAGIAEDLAYTFAFKRRPHDLRAGEHRCSCSGFGLRSAHLGPFYFVTRCCFVSTLVAKLSPRPATPS